MSRWLYVLDFNGLGIYEIEITEEEYRAGDSEDLLRKLGFNEDEASYLFSPVRLKLITELVKDR